MGYLRTKEGSLSANKLLSAVALAELRQYAAPTIALNQLLEHIDAQREQIASLLAERDAWQRLMTEEVLPRYGEMFEHLGLGAAESSVVYDMVSELLRAPGDI